MPLSVRTEPFSVAWERDQRTKDASEQRKNRRRMRSIALNFPSDGLTNGPRVRGGELPGRDDFRERSPTPRPSPHDRFEPDDRAAARWALASLSAEHRIAANKLHTDLHAAREQCRSVLVAVLLWPP